MPGFKKDPMAMPDMKGNQWARPGGMMGRNRVGANPHAPHKAPAANANPYAQPIPGNLLSPSSVTNPQQQPNNPLSKNPFIGKLGAALMPSVVDQVPSLEEMRNTRLKPTPTNPQPMQPTQVGQFMPNTAKTALANGNPDPTNAMAVAGKALLSTQSKPNSKPVSVAELMQPNTVYPSKKPIKQPVSSYAGKYGSYGASVAFEAGKGHRLVERPDLPINALFPNEKIANGLLRRGMQWAGSKLPALNPMRWFNRAAPAAANTAARQAPRSHALLGGMGTLGVGAAMFGPAMMGYKSQTYQPLPNGPTSFGWGADKGIDMNNNNPYVSNPHTPSHLDPLARDKFNYGMYNSFNRDYGAAMGKKSSVIPPFTPSKLVGYGTGLSALGRGLTAKDNNLQEAGKGALVGASTGLAANYTGHNILWRLMKRLNGKRVTPTQLATNVVLPTIAAGALGGAAGFAGSRYSLGDYNKRPILRDLLKSSDLKTHNWSQLHDLVLDPPSMPEIAAGAKNILGTRVNKQKSILRRSLPFALPVAAGALGYGAYTLGRKLLKLGAISAVGEGQDQIKMKTAPWAQQGEDAWDFLDSRKQTNKRADLLDRLVEQVWGDDNSTLVKISAYLGPIGTPKRVPVIEGPSPDIARSRVVAKAAHTKNSVGEEFPMTEEDEVNPEGPPQVDPYAHLDPMVGGFSTRSKPAPPVNRGYAPVRSNPFAYQSNRPSVQSAPVPPTPPPTSPVSFQPPQEMVETGPRPAMGARKTNQLGEGYVYNGQDWAREAGKAPGAPAAPTMAPKTPMPPAAPVAPPRSPDGPNNVPPRPGPVSPEEYKQLEQQFLAQKAQNPGPALAPSYDTPASASAAPAAPQGVGRLHGSIQRAIDATKNPAAVQMIERQKAKLQQQLGVARSPAAINAINRKLRNYDKRLADHNAGTSPGVRMTQRMEQNTAQDYLAQGHSPEAVNAWSQHQAPRHQQDALARQSWEQGGSVGQAPRMPQMSQQGQLAVSAGIKKPAPTPGYVAPQVAGRGGMGGSRMPPPTINAAASPVTGYAGKQTGKTPALGGPKALPGLPNPIGLGPKGPSTKLGMDKQAIIGRLGMFGKQLLGNLNKVKPAGGLIDDVTKAWASSGDEMAKLPGLMPNWGKGEGMGAAAQRFFYRPASGATQSRISPTMSRLWNAPGMQPLRGALTGGAIGEGADSIAGLAGYEDTNFGTYGAAAGGLSRIPGVKQFLRRSGMPGLSKAYGQAGKAFTMHMNPGMSGWAGFGPGTAGKVRGALIGGGMAAEPIKNFAVARGQEAAMNTADQLAQRFGFENIDSFLSSPTGQAMAGYNRGGLMGGLQGGWAALPDQAKMQLLAGGAGLLGGGALAAGGQMGAGAGLGLGGAALAANSLGAFGGVPGDWRSMISNNPESHKRLGSMIDDADFKVLPLGDQSRLVDEAMQRLEQQNQLGAASG